MAVFETWIWVSLAAASFQTVRFMLQKQLSTATLSAGGATFARFFYSAPFILVLLAGYLAVSGAAFPALGQGFLIYGLAGGTAQILATLCVVLLFQQRNFAVGITFKKTEVIQTVLLGWLVLGEGVTALQLLAILIGVVGVLLLSTSAQTGALRLRDFSNRATALGLACGVFFAISAVTYRGATLEVGSDDPFLRASITLAVVVALQTVIMGIWLGMREPGQIRAVWSARKVAVWIGLMSLGGSLCWFIAFTLQNAAYVKAVGQIELIFSLLASTLFFKEKITGRELAGMAVILCSIIFLISVA